MLIRTLCMALLATLYSGVMAEGLDFSEYLDPDLAGFVLNNAAYLRYEIKHEEGPRFESLMRYLHRQHNRVNVNCVSMAQERASSDVALYREIMRIDGNCTEQ